MEPSRPFAHHSFYASARCAINGVASAFRSERNIRIDFAASLLVGVASGFLGISTAEIPIVLLAAGLVASAELLNTAIEDAVDLAQPQPHPLAARAKDVAAGGVFIAALTAGLVGLAVFVPKVLRILQGPPAVSEANLFVGFTFLAALALFLAWWTINPVRPARTFEEE